MTNSSGKAAPLGQTSLYDCHLASGARMVPFAGYSMPIRYGSQVEEHHAVRKAAGLFDVSHMGEVFVEGPQALDFLQRLTPNNVAKLAINQAHYSALLNERAGFIDDLLVYRLGEQSFLLVVNAGGRVEDVAWINRQAVNFDVTVTDRSDDFSLIALQGPKSVEILSELCEIDLGALAYYWFCKADVAGFPSIVSRTGYTGEDGFEIYMENAVAAELWRTLLTEGGGRGLVPAGLAARDTLRLEAGMLLSGQDIGPDITPIEAGVGWFVKLKKGVDCIGSEVLSEQRKQGVRRRLVGFELEGRAMARSGYRVVVNTGDAAIEGVVTSGSWSPTLEKSIGIARIESDQFIDAPPAGTPVEADIRKTQAKGRIVSLPFYARER